ncbi:MAG: 2-methylcitrate dehydratase [Betaproteobacteria bacterium]|nr:2-methylcitrate dehydratase [Betaproteobacteria bacterium]
MESKSDRSISHVIGAFVSEVRYEQLPGDFVEFLKDHIIDVVGTSIAATRFDFAYRALAGLGALADSHGSTVVGMAQKLPLKDAALMNGVLAHGLDYDDTHAVGPVHPSASAFPCALGVGEFINCSGRDLLLAYALGIEFATRLGLAANGTMHKTGFHTTGVVGHNACAVTAGKLLGLNADQLVMAQGLAGSTASAIAEHRKDGAWNKRIHPGWAAVGGMTAASLACAGFIGTKKVYEGGDGLFRTHAGSHFDDVNLDALTADLGERWRAEEVAIKPYPVCHILHACIDSAIALRTQHELKPSDIAKVRVLLHPDTFHYVCENAEMRRRPATDYAAKFSAHYTTAVALIRGKCGFAELEQDAITNPAILALAQKVEHAPDPKSAFPEYFSGGVEITLANGRTIAHHDRVNRGAGDRALNREDITQKFLENAEFGMSRSRAEDMLQVLLSLERFSGREIARAVSLGVRL